MSLKQMQSQILSHRGASTQISKLQEEIEELSHEIEWIGKSYQKPISTFTFEFLSEFADVKNMMSQIEMLMSPEETVIVESIQSAKCKRELDRIRTEKQ